MNRPCKTAELEIRREEKVTASELAAVFRQWLGVLERELEPTAYYRVLPGLRAATTGRVGLPGASVGNGGAA